MHLRSRKHAEPELGTKSNVFWTRSTDVKKEAREHFGQDMRINSEGLKKACGKEKKEILYNLETLVACFRKTALDCLQTEPEHLMFLSACIHFDDSYVEVFTVRGLQMERL